MKTYLQHVAKRLLLINLLNTPLHLQEIVIPTALTPEAKDEKVSRITKEASFAG